MRSTTLLAHIMRACILAVALLALPQLASAQLPLETKSLRIQATSGTNAVSLTASTVTTPYALNYPATGSPGGGAFIYATNGTGDLGWTNAPTAQQTTLFWNGTTVEWVDPNNANNPNWSRTGNAVGGILGTTAAGQAINFVTGDATNIRMTLEADGDLLINTTATGGATTTIGRASGHTTVVDGTLDVNGSTTIDGATVAIDGATSTTINGGASTGSVTIGGTGAQTVDIATGAAAKTVSIGSTNTTSTTNISAGSGEININGNIDVAAGGLLKFANDEGSSGDVLVSQGNTASPQWQNLNEAIGIRAAGNVTVATAANATAAISVPNLAATDAILITLQGSGSTVVATVTNRTDGAIGNFIVTFSGAYAGVVNYMVIKQL